MNLPDALTTQPSLFLTPPGEALPSACVSDADESDQRYHHGHSHEEAAETRSHCGEYPRNASAGVGETHRSSWVLEGTRTTNVLRFKYVCGGEGVSVCNQGHT